MQERTRPPSCAQLPEPANADEAFSSDTEDDVAMLDHAAGDIDEDAAAVVLGGLSAVCPRLSPKLGGGRRMVTVRVRLCGVGPCANYCGTSASFVRR